jgi:hypothetical protein
MASGSSCVLTITPGATPSAAAGATPNPSTITVQGANTNTLTADISVLTYGSIYQQGYIYSIDDTTPITESMGGKVAALADNSTGIQWYNGSDTITGASSLDDGASNTSTIVSAQGAGSYAASLCANYTIDSAGNTPCTTGTCYTNWYLPAICEMGPEQDGSGCVSGTPNMVNNLVDLSVGSFSSSSNYWSSTEWSGIPADFVWSEFFGTGSNNNQAVETKADLLNVRCARVLTP